ncbi:MAG: right-handed parallel beta-helix repeat-containing protein [Pontiellaceae bacterium]|nr:right-handed parallel beta-helix repeat-containing protein [Pontiellaceae bacterium]
MRQRITVIFFTFFPLVMLMAAPGGPDSRIIRDKPAVAELSDRQQVLSLITSSKYYLDAVAGSDTEGDGSSAHPWQTLQKAQSVAVGGDGIFLRNGNYGTYTETTSGRTAWVVYINDEGHAPVIAGISSRFDTPRDVYLVFYGIKIMPDWVDPAGDAAWQAAHPGSTDPQYPNSTSKTYKKTASVIDGLNSNYLRIINCEIAGTNKHLTPYGFNSSGCNDVLVKGCHIHRVSRGIQYIGAARVSVLYNHIHNITSSFIVSGGNCSDVLIEGNNAYDSNWTITEDWCPRIEYYHASFIAIRSSNVTIRGNIFHNGATSSTIMIYDDDGDPAVYHNITIENNLLYDPENATGLRINRVGTNIAVRNNILVGRQRPNTQPGPQQYSQVFSLESIADGYDGSGLSVYNNIFAGQASFLTWFTNVHEGGNIYWSLVTTPGNYLTQADVTSGSKVITSQVGTAPDYFTNGFFNGVLDFSWTEDPAPPVPHGHGKVIDYTYAAGSEARNFGDATHQPADSLGSIDSAGFIFDNGRTRDPTHHSAGCYEPLDQTPLTVEFAVTAGNLNFRWDFTGARVRVEWSPGLTNPDWQFTGISTRENEAEIPMPAERPVGFYRLVVE